MYVCVCHALNDKSLEKLIDEGQNNMKKLMRCSGAGSDCGSCIGDVKKLLGQRDRENTCCNGKPPHAASKAT